MLYNKWPKHLSILFKTITEMKKKETNLNKILNLQLS